MSKKVEKLAETLMNLNPEEQQELQLIIRAKMMPEMARRQGLLQQQQNPQMAAMGQRPMNMRMPNAQDAARQGLLR